MADRVARRREISDSANFKGSALMKICLKVELLVLQRNSSGFREPNGQTEVCRTG